MGYLLEHYKAACDPYHLGHTTVEQLGMGYPLTGGMVFPYPAGGVMLLRRRLYPTTGEWSYCGYARPGENTIKNGQGFGHGGDEAFQYTTAVVLGNGYISKLHEPVRVDFDGAGDLITPPLPMFPINVVALPLAGGKFRVVWEYDGFGQGAHPTDFQVFGGTSPETVDYDTPLVDSVTGLSVVTYAATRTRYTFTTPAHGDGATAVFSVRGRNSSGVAELNTNTSSAKTAQASAPAAAVPTEVVMRRV